MYYKYMSFNMCVYTHKSIKKPSEDCVTFWSFPFNAGISCTRGSLEYTNKINSIK